MRRAVPSVLAVLRAMAPDADHAAVAVDRVAPLELVPRSARHSSATAAADKAASTEKCNEAND